MFTKKADYANIKEQTKRRHHFMINRFFAIKFPANAQMSFNEYENGGLLFYGSLIRLPLQFLLIYWVYRLRK